LLLALLSAAVIAAAPVPVAPRVAKPEVHQLKNGMRVVFIPFDSPGLVAYYTLMRVGSRNEPEPGRSGYAHFFEHMMFRGTPTTPGDKYNAAVVELGLDTNAFTSEDMTVYHLFGPAKALPTIIDLEADRFQNLAYSEDQFKTEAGAILGEYAKGASNPLQLMSEKVLETAFTDHTYRHTVIGYLADVKAMPAGFDYSHEFFRRYYTPDNATLFVVGDFDHAATLAHIEKAYGTWKGKVRPATIRAEPPQRIARRASIPWNSPTLPRVWINWHTPSAANLRATAIQLVLNEYLFGETSPLVQDLVRTRQIADAVDATYGPQRDPSLFGVLLRMKADKDLPVGEQAVLAEIQRLAGGKVDARRVATVRSNVKYARLMAQDKANRVAVEAAVTTALTGDIGYQDQLLTTIGTVKPDELSAFARKYLVPSNSTTVTLQTTPAPATGGTN
jgi:zinc protease